MRGLIFTIGKSQTIIGKTFETYLLYSSASDKILFQRNSSTPLNYSHGFNAGSWHHVALVFAITDGYILYLDGLPTKTVTDTTIINTNNVTTKIGAGSWTENFSPALLTMSDLQQSLICLCYIRTIQRFSSNRHYQSTTDIASSSATLNATINPTTKPLPLISNMEQRGGLNNQTSTQSITGTQTKYHSKFK